MPSLEGQKFLPLQGETRKGVKNVRFQAKIAHLTILIPLNGIFHANFSPWHHEGNTRDFLCQVWKVKIFCPPRGDSRRGQKLPFLSQNRPFGFMLILHSDLKKTTIETLQAKFGRSQFSCFGGEESERGKKWQFLSQNCKFGHFDPPTWYYSC